MHQYLSRNTISWLRLSAWGLGGTSIEQRKIMKITQWKTPPLVIPRLRLGLFSPYSRWTRIRRWLNVGVTRTKEPSHAAAIMGMADVAWRCHPANADSADRRAIMFHCIQPLSWLSFAHATLSLWLLKMRHQRDGIIALTLQRFSATSWTSLSQETASAWWYPLPQLDHKIDLRLLKRVHLTHLSTTGRRLKHGNDACIILGGVWGIQL